MKILTASQVKEVDRSTIENQHISSWDLMERAATQLAKHFTETFSPTPIFIMVGNGGNGGDGLAMARILSTQGYHIYLLTLFDELNCSEEYLKNLQLLPCEVKTTSQNSVFFNWIEQEQKGVVIDAIFGIGYTIREYETPIKELILYTNNLDRQQYKVVAIDTPSGMGSTLSDVNQLKIDADHTFTIYSPKLPMLMPKHGECVGELSIIDINYSKEALQNLSTHLYYTDNIDELIPKRKKFAHKSNFGSLLIIGGGSGMFGASIIAARGAEAIGCGIITVLTPSTYESALYSNIPSAMTLQTNDRYFMKAPDNIEKYTTVCVGMGMGRELESIGALSELFLRCNAQSIQMVIDADALNLVSENIELRHLIPEESILTPHIGEFRRLVGEWQSDEEKLEKLSQLSIDTNCTIILKGAHSAIATPQSNIYFNSTGNPSMARAASGDMLAGIAAALLARGLSSKDAAIAAAYLHGKAADRAAKIYGENFVTIDRWLSCFHSLI